MKVSLVVPNWNGAEKLRQNLTEVLKVQMVDEFIVVDDASSDESVEVVERDFPEVTLIKRLKNGGFSSAVNDGVKEASGELVFVLNSDAVPEVNCLMAVLPHFEEKEVFSVGCSVGGNWNWAEFKDGWFWHKMAPGSPPSEAHETLWSSGGSAVFRKSVWEELGGLDELFNPFYEEDLDIGYRARKRGYKNIWEPKSKVEHYKQKGVIAENFSKEHVQRVAERNHLFFMWKNLTSKELINEHISALIKYLLLHPGYWRIFWSALLKLPEVRKKRLVEARQQKVTDEEILSKFEV